MVKKWKIANTSLKTDKVVPVFKNDSLSVTGSLPLIWMDSITHIHGLGVYVKEGLLFAQDLSLENSADS